MNAIVGESCFITPLINGRITVISSSVIDVADFFFFFFKLGFFSVTGMPALCPRKFLVVAACVLFFSTRTNTQPNSCYDRTLIGVYPFLSADKQPHTKKLGII